MRISALGSCIQVFYIRWMVDQLQYMYCRQTCSVHTLQDWNVHTGTLHDRILEWILTISWIVFPRCRYQTTLCVFTTTMLLQRQNLVKAIEATMFVCLWPQQSQDEWEKNSVFLMKLARREVDGAVGLVWSEMQIQKRHQLFPSNFSVCIVIQN